MAPVKCCLFFILSMSAMDSGANNRMAMATSDKVHHCEHDSHWFSFDEHCYLPMSNSLDWNSAEEFCSSKEANLISIHSNTETNFVSNLIKSHSNIETDRVWIGLHAYNADDEFEWNDDSNLDFVNWNLQDHSGSHFDNEAICVSFIPETGHWDEGACDDKFGFVCKKLKPVGEHHPHDHTKGLSVGAIIGISIGCLLLLIFAITGCVYLRPWVTSHCIKEPIK